MVDTSTDQKLDAQTSLLKWILGGVASGVAALAIFASSVFTSFLSRSQQGEEFLRKEVKDAIIVVSQTQKDLADSQKSVTKAMDNQTTILQQIRDDQRGGVWRSTKVQE